VLGCLNGLAVGDAIGKQTENLSHNDVRRWYPNGIAGFEHPLGQTIPRYAGKKREWFVGETTDDTERTLAVARAIVRDRFADHTAVGRELLTCAKSVHPGVRSLWEFHEAADPARIAHLHDGCGAAIRVASIGIAFRPHELRDLVHTARQASIPTHGGSRAGIAAVANAAAVSGAVEGMTTAAIIRVVQDAAAIAEGEQASAPAGAFQVLLHEAVHQFADGHQPSASELAAVCFPDQTFAIVALGLALGLFAGSARHAVLLAANIGGDADSVASIAGGIAGAMYPDSVPAEWVADVERLNGHRLTAVAELLAAVRP
jgi:ADP-ribosylglycohydrolase